MKWSQILFLVLVITGVTLAQSDIDAKVDQLLNEMTVAEKVGQMTQIAIDFISNAGEAQGQDALQLDPARMELVIQKYHVGSILNVGTHAHSVAKWHEIITAIQDMALQKTRLRIPVIYGIDAVHGANYTRDATLFPQAISMAATWNPELLKKTAEITALETRASGIPWNFNPVLDSGRQPLWPRLWETFGEDAYLASILGVAYVKGLEGDSNDISAPDKVAACLKHYIGYGTPVTGKDRTPAWIPDHYLRQYHLPPYAAAIAAGAHTLMPNSGDVNGVPVHASHYLLTELLRGELGFEGVVISDWADITNLHTRHRVAANNKEAVRLAVMAGVDMSMVPTDLSFPDALIELVQEGSVPMERIDEAVRRILTLKYRLGLFERPYPDKSLQAQFASPAAAAVNLQAAREAMILLKNDNRTLPLRKSLKVLVTGPNAERLSPLNSGWTITWQGNREELYPKDKWTVRKAIEAKIGKANVAYVQGATVDRETGIAAAVKAAKKADVVVACLGEDAYCETPGNITDLTLPEAQLNLVKALQATGKPVVLVLIEGRPRIIRSIVEDSRAIVLAFLPGLEGGRAIADVLFGDANPGGKLPVTYPRHPNDLVLYDHVLAENTGGTSRYHPQWPFGFGLSYTTFAYSDLRLDKQNVPRGETVTAQITVKNTGQMAGKETVQLYLSDVVASITPPNRRLQGFEKIDLAPGESKTVSFTLGEAAMSFVGLDGKPVVEPGQFKVSVGHLQQTFEVK